MDIQIWYFYITEYYSAKKERYISVISMAVDGASIVMVNETIQANKFKYSVTSLL